MACLLHSTEADVPFTCVRSMPFSAANFFARGLTNSLPFGAAGVAARGADGAGATGWGTGGTEATFQKKLNCYFTTAKTGLKDQVFTFY